MKKQQPEQAIKVLSAWVGRAVVGGLLFLFCLSSLGLELPAPDPQDRTQNEMRRVGDAMLAWLADQTAGGATQGCLDPIDLTTYPAIGWSAVRDQLVPRYLSELPQQDAWGHNYSYFLDDSSSPDPLLAIRSSGADGSFTGLEFQRGVVTDPNEDLVWADGYFVRWAVPTRDVVSQQNTVRQTRAVGEAMISYLTDILARQDAAELSEAVAPEAFATRQGSGEGSEGAEIDLVVYDPIDFSQLESVLVPDYLSCLPRLDGWGNQYLFYLRENPQPGDTELAAIRSAGGDGQFLGTTYPIAPFLPAELDEDVVWADGSFARWPKEVEDAPETELGSIVRVNASINGVQGQPAIAMPSRDVGLVFWQSPADDGLGIVARTVNPDGVPSGPEQPVETRTAGDQEDPQVAAGGGQAVVVWRTTAGGGPEIAARRFDAQGQPLGEELVVGKTAAADASPAVAVASDGSFLVAWTAPSSVEGVDHEIRVRAFTPEGFALGEERSLPPATPGSSDFPAVAAGAGGTYLVAWEGELHPRRGIYGQLLDSTAAAVGDIALLHQFTRNSHRFPAVAADRSGRFAVAWFHKEFLHNFDGFVLARRLAADLTPIGQASVVGEVSLTEGGGNFDPQIALTFDDLGALLVVWQGSSLSTGDESFLGRLFDADGRPRGEQFDLASSGFNQFQEPAVAAGPGSDFLVLRQAPDADGLGVYLRRVGRRVFLDGFESGDLEPWLD